MAQGDVLVLPGGGAKGSVQFGMIKEYIKEFGYPSVVIGTSVGTLNGALVAARQVDDLEKIWLSIKSGRDVYKPRFINDFLSKLIFAFSSSIYTTEPLDMLIERFLDIQKLRKSDIGFYACVWNATRNKGQVIRKSAPYILDAIKASARIPIVFPETKISGEYYFDGGVTDNVPVKFCFTKNQYGQREIGMIPKRIFVLMTAADQSSVNYSHFNKIPRIAARVVDGLTAEGKRDDLKLTILRNRMPEYESIETFICDPIRPTITTLEFESSKIKESIEVGMQSFKENLVVYNESNGFNGEKYIRGE